jgi:ABC-type lipoprotein release transport system permease subunit
MSDGSYLFLIIGAVFLILMGSAGIHSLRNPASPLFNFMVIILVGGLICLGVGAILTVLSLLNSL